MNDNDSNLEQILRGTLPLPVWDEWKTIEQARLWQAVSLACNIDPSHFTIQKFPQLNRFFTRPPQHFEDLLLMAKSNIGNSGILKLISKSTEGIEESDVRLSNFVTWLKSIKHQIPMEFPWQQEAITFSNMDWPWGRHETDLLRKLAAAADKFWTLYDPNDQSTAPKKNQVVAWLVSQGVSSNMAEAMATILRVDGLPTRTKK
ncbi:hypothetical protein [Sulfurirhabdus autotrophica]|uniref:Uncharacterized protein n=1 Tax=Sulfurirhabdus autotrophica TaxID=1706046 RepID=A0A4R3YHR8_9PROT|nr:hypothetical protein [Sulfurirhabdus autotrophica]TCV90544.1 hypothetical protein EDC63_101518 [Sulfurirhabdus autotrophica]